MALSGFACGFKLSFKGMSTCQLNWVWRQTVRIRRIHLARSEISRVLMGVEEATQQFDTRRAIDRPSEVEVSRLLSEAVQEDCFVRPSGRKKGNWNLAQTRLALQLATGEKCIWSVGRQDNQCHVYSELSEDVQRRGKCAAPESKRVQSRSQTLRTVTTWVNHEDNSRRCRLLRLGL